MWSHFGAGHHQRRGPIVFKSPWICRLIGRGRSADVTAAAVTSDYRLLNSMAPAIGPPPTPTATTSGVRGACRRPPSSHN